MRSEFSLMNPSINEDKREESGLRDVRIIWGAVIAILLSVIGLSWYGYSYITGTSAFLEQIPGLQDMANKMTDHLKAVDATLNDWAADRTALTDRMAKLEKTASANLKTARTQAQSRANEVGQRLRQEMVDNFQRLQARLGNVESTQRETLDDVSQLQAELSNVRQEMASMQQQNAERLTELQAAQAEVNRINNQMNTVRGEITKQGERIQALNNEVGRERTSFQVPANHTQQIASGIYVTISHIDVAHQSVDGWMQLADEGRIVWIRSLPAEQALTFVTRSDNRTHELVFTAINPNGASGYVLLPTSNSHSPVLTSN
jgi:predicted nuclease with TOPRIM domain